MLAERLVHNLFVVAPRLAAMAEAFERPDPPEDAWIDTSLATSAVPPPKGQLHCGV
jgi:hypothetical protein